MLSRCGPMQLAPLQLASESELLRRDSRDRAGFMLIAMGLILVLTALVGGGLVLPDLQVGAAHETEPAPLPTSPIGTKAPTLPRPVASQTPTSSPQVQPSPADAAPPAAAAPGPVHLIIDTDLSFDVDDVGAVCIAHELARRGEVRIEAIVHDSGLPLGAGALSSLSAFYGANVPLGAYKGTFGVDRSGRWIEGPYVRALVEAFPTDVVDSSGVPTAVDVLRAALAGAAAPVTIAAIGFATNLAALLRSSPDKHSSLSGRELVEQKVAQVVWQGGWYEPLHPNGHTTFNWDCGHDSGYDTSLGCAGDAGFAVANMPSTVDQIFSDLGDDVYAAARLKPLTRRSDASPPHAFAPHTGADGTALRSAPAWTRPTHVARPSGTPSGPAAIGSRGIQSSCSRLSVALRESVLTRRTRAGSTTWTTWAQTHGAWRTAAPRARPRGRAAWRGTASILGTECAGRRARRLTSYCVPHE